jgi:hypothetical protein
MRVNRACVGPVSAYVDFSLYAFVVAVGSRKRPNGDSSVRRPTQGELLQRHSLFYAHSLTPHLLSNRRTSGRWSATYCSFDATCWPSTRRSPIQFFRRTNQPPCLEAVTTQIDCMTPQTSNARRKLQPARVCFWREAFQTAAAKGCDGSCRRP